MITKDQINSKAMDEAVIYYLEQRIEQDKSDLKHVIHKGVCIIGGFEKLNYYKTHTL